MLHQCVKHPEISCVCDIYLFFQLFYGYCVTLLLLICVFVNATISLTHMDQGFFFFDYIPPP
jgi:hypothetical protein